MDEKIAIKFDKWQLVQEALDKSVGDKKNPGNALIVVAIAQAWNPSSLFMAREFERLRKNKNAVPIFIVDHDVETNKTASLDLHTTPALFFYKGGKQMNVRRSGWSDDNKFVGTTSRENINEIIRQAQFAVKDNLPHVDLNF